MEKKILKKTPKRLIYNNQSKLLKKLQNKFSLMSKWR